MRRIHRAVPLLALTCALFAALAGPAAAQQAKPDLMVSSAAEPPDFVPLDGDFLASFTVDNQGRGRAGQTSLARAYLSVGRVMSADDRRRRVGQRRVRALRPGRSTTRRMVVDIPAAFRTGEYFLIVCADVRNVIDETNDRANCHVSGQKIRIAAADDANRGPAGPPGPPGPAGPAGSGGADTIKIPRKTLNLGTATLLSPEGSGPGDNEGSTQQFDLAEVGGVRIRALCVSTTNGNDRLPGTDDDDDGFPQAGNSTSYDEDGDEAKILLYMDRPEGNFSFAGPHGRRFNI
ncbi:MAG TPA: CARDB domain-containing protein, partial [Solirubrobacteraceae bacterium]